MLKFAPAICLVLAACATGAAVRGDREGAARLDLAAIAGTARGFPRAKDPQLPSVDGMSRRIRDEIGDVASAEVRLCVGAELVRDMSDWQFSETPAATLSLQRQSCGIAKVSYRVNQRTRDDA